MRKIEITKLYQWCDGWRSQYKSGYTFAEISRSETVFRFPTVRYFSGSEHGKGENDGETGLIKSTVENAILGKKILIGNAEEMTRLGEANLSNIKGRRKFMLVDKEIIAKRRKAT